MKIIIRPEEEKDHRIVEELTREAFWNLYIPGCNEHLLVHKLRQHDDFIAELDFVAVKDGTIAGNIMYSRSYILLPDGKKYDTVTFGPVSVLPEMQNQGIGSALIKHSLKEAASRGYKAVIIYGYPQYYEKFGFKSAKSFNITNTEGEYPAAHLILELEKDALKGISGKSFETNVFAGLGEEETEEFDKSFKPKEKKHTETQDTFEAMSKAFL